MIHLYDRFYWVGGCRRVRKNLFVKYNVNTFTSFVQKLPNIFFLVEFFVWINIYICWLTLNIYSGVGGENYQHLFIAKEIKKYSVITYLTQQHWSIDRHNYHMDYWYFFIMKYHYIIVIVLFYIYNEWMFSVFVQYCNFG